MSDLDAVKRSSRQFLGFDVTVDDFKRLMKKAIDLVDLDLKSEDYCSTLRDETLEAASRFKELIQQKAMI